MENGITLGKFFENLDAKSRILVTTCCEISCFLKTTAKKLRGPFTKMVASKKEKKIYNKQERKQK